jgi:hypothetical protein
VPSEAARGLLADVDGFVGAIGSRLAGLSEVVSARAAEISGQLTRVSESVDGKLREIEGRLGEGKERLSSIIADVTSSTQSDFDNLLQMIRDSGIGFAEAIAQAGENVKTGDIALQDFLKAYGEVVATVNGETIGQLVASMNLGPLQESLSDARKRMREDLTDIEDVMSALSKVNNRAAEDFLQILELWQKGKISAKEALEAVERLDRALPDGGLTSDLADDIERLLLDNLRGDQRSFG